MDERDGAKSREGPNERHAHLEMHGRVLSTDGRRSGGGDKHLTRVESIL